MTDSQKISNNLPASLERVGKYLYDSCSVYKGASLTSFFQNPNGRDERWTNLLSAGAFTWPKSFLIQEIEIICPNYAKDSLEEKGTLTIQLKDDVIFKKPLKDMRTNSLAPGWYIPNFESDNDISNPYVAMRLAEHIRPPPNTSPSPENHGSGSEIPEYEGWDTDGFWIPSVKNFRVMLDVDSGFDFDGSTTRAPHVRIGLAGILIRETVGTL